MAKELKLWEAHVTEIYRDESVDPEHPDSLATLSYSRYIAGRTKKEARQNLFGRSIETELSKGMGGTAGHRYPSQRVVKIREVKIPGKKISLEDVS